MAIVYWYIAPQTLTVTDYALTGAFFFGKVLSVKGAEKRSSHARFLLRSPIALYIQYIQHMGHYIAIWDPFRYCVVLFAEM